MEKEFMTQRLEQHKTAFTLSYTNNNTNNLWELNTNTPQKKYG